MADHGAAQDPAHGAVVAFFIAGRAGAPMQPQRTVELVAGKGIAGDRYLLGTGHWTDPRWPDQELTLIMAETAAALGLDPASLRRNIVTRGVELEALIGATFQLGEATLLGVRRCDPCRYIERFTRPGVMRELAARGGLRARILIGGRVQVGDRLSLIAPAPVAAAARPRPADSSEPNTAGVAGHEPMKGEHPRRA